MKANLERPPICEAIALGVKSRIRSIVMIALMGSIGLLPVALSTCMGSEVQKPFATMIVGGLQICMLLSFTVSSIIFYYFYKDYHRIILLIQIDEESD
ncbi:MAG: efflux RND transporter permease subunit [Chitinophagales bacterium]|nr:efflux RND transporter permease subunit [Chitinophagales bacterium]